MRIKVDRYCCHGCGNCRSILNIDDDEMVKMPQMAFDGWHISRLPEGAKERIQQAIDECPAYALEFEE